MRKYLVEDSRHNGIDEIFTDYYDTLGEANRAAERMWNDLSAYDRKNRTVKVGWVTPEDVDESLRISDDDDWWTLCVDWDCDDTCLAFGE